MMKQIYELVAQAIVYYTSGDFHQALVLSTEAIRAIQKQPGAFQMQTRLDCHINMQFAVLFELKLIDSKQSLYKKFESDIHRLRRLSSPPRADVARLIYWALCDYMRLSGAIHNQFLVFKRSYLYEIARRKK